MQATFLKYLETHELVAKNEKILIAVSGGIDSVVMADLFCQSGYKLGVAHCNFQLRGEESEDDERFVKSLCKKLNVQFFSKKFQTSEFAEKLGISIQMAARELRYQWLLKLKENEGFDKIAFAHHKDDQLETILFNLTKGTGIAGLTGMQPKRDEIIRPLLFADREQLINYAHVRGLKWREDSSNQSLKYNRNLIRHKIIPVLKQINPGLLDTLDSTLLRLIETESVLNEKLLAFLRDDVRKQGKDLYISKSSLGSSIFPTLQLHAVASPFGFNYLQCVNIIESMGQVGNLFYGTRGVLNVDRTDLILSPLEDDDFKSPVYNIKHSDKELKLDQGRLVLDTLDLKEFRMSQSSSIACIDFKKLKFPLKIRHWAAGDWFIPLGMKGKKKVSDLMIDEKIPLNLKKRVLVVESDGDIVWIIGHRIDDRYKITATTTVVWQAKYEED